MNVYKYNMLSVDSKELENTAIFFAEMYHYDKMNGSRPSSPMRIFYDEFGISDDPESHMHIFEVYLDLCEKYKNDPEIIATYESICEEE